MEFSIFIPLMVQVIKSASEVLSNVISKTKDIANNYIFDKEFVEKTIIDSTDQLTDLLNATSFDVKQEIREQSIKDVVQDLQAHISVIGKLLSRVEASEITPAIADQLIRGGLYPLEASLEKAKIRLKSYDEDDMFLYCHIIGTKTLLAGYAYVGQNIPTLQKDLEGSSYIFQKRLLNLIARMKIEANLEIPWDKVPQLIILDGISDLFELYNSTLQLVEKNTHPAEEPVLKPNTSITTKQRRVRKVPEFLTNSLRCSECGYKVKLSTSVCPGCQRNFVS